MKNDIDLKKLFAKVMDDVLLEVVGDKDATMEADPATLELQEARRTPDLVAKLHSKEGLLYYRLFEFNTYESERVLLERCALYILMLRAQVRAPVVATIIQVRPPAIVGELTLGAPPKSEVCRWHFDVVNLWNLPAEMAFERRSPGLLALVPLMKGSTPALAEQALRALLALDGSVQVADARVVLLNLAEEKYPGSRLRNLVSREQIMNSSLFEEFRGEIWAEAQADGRLDAERELCLEKVRRDYPELFAVTTPVVEGCSDPEKLKEWILASGLDSAEFSRLLGLKG